MSTESRAGQAVGRLRRDRSAAVTPMRRAVRSVGLVAGAMAFWLTVSVMVTWPRARGLTVSVPGAHDVGNFVWCLWWTPHALLHGLNPYHTDAFFAPVGTHLGFHTLSPLVGVLMSPVTLTLGPGVALNVLALVIPAVSSYAAQRAARLLVHHSIAAVVAGVLYGGSTMLTWRAWYHLNIAAGAVFLPLAFETALRLRREPTTRRGVVLGLVLGLALLTDQQGFLLSALVAMGVLASRAWHLLRHHAHVLVGAGITWLIIGLPQLLAMAAQAVKGNAGSDPRILAAQYRLYGAAPSALMAPSPALEQRGFPHLFPVYFSHHNGEGAPTYGSGLVLLAVIGAVLTVRCARTRWLVAAWVGLTWVAMGPSLWLLGREQVPAPIHVHGTTLSALMPYTWLVRVPGLADFREAARFAQIGLLAACLLAAIALDSRRGRRALFLAPVVAFALLESGWSAVAPIGRMPIHDRAITDVIAADRSNSVVVNMPLSYAGGVSGVGAVGSAEAQMRSIDERHSMAGGSVSRFPPKVESTIRSHRFLLDLLSFSTVRRPAGPGSSGPACIDARSMNIGWVVLWGDQAPGLVPYLAGCGFVLETEAHGVRVLRSSHIHRATSG